MSASFPDNTLQPTQRPDATLIVQETFRGAQQQPQVITLGNKPMKIGRTAQGGKLGPNDIALGSPFISRDHARIEPDGMGHRIVDLGSINGLAYQGEKIQQRTLQHGDVLRVYEPSSGDFVTLTYTNSLLAAQQPPPPIPSFTLDPARPQMTIGRQTNDIRLDHPSVSRQHAIIERRADGGHVLRDAGSANGTFVNGQRVSQHTLKREDVIQVGPFKLVYKGASLDQYDQRGGMRIDVRNMTLTVKNKRDGKPLDLLKDVSLCIEPREFVAFVGGSGAGKSTLMKAISGYQRSTNGQVLVNGDDYYRNFDAYRTMLGYVPQDDILHRTLPVDKALDYAASLRLPSDTEQGEVTRRIDRALDDVEMIPHRTKQIDNLSGGQRKRVSIAAELLAEPTLFFLDEPTSGLDPGLEKKMMYTLRRLADSGRTVVLVTHATENITLCDHVVFMSRGRLLYYGPPGEALNFFGVTTGSFSDIYTRLEGPADPNDKLVQGHLQQEYATWRSQHSQAGSLPDLNELWEIKYRNSPQYRQYVADRQTRAPGTPGTEAKDGGSSHKATISPLRQFAILTRRYFDLTIRDRFNLLILLLQSPIIALMLWLLASEDALVGVTELERVQRVEALSLVFVLAAVGIWFGVINAAREITKESAIYARERFSNLSITAYIASKFTILSLLLIIQNVVLLGILALRVTYPEGDGTLLPVLAELFITIMLASWAGMALGLVISAMSSTIDQAISMVPLILIPQILFGGVIFKINEGVINVLSWFMISRWAVDAFGTSVNLNALCQLPNVEYDEEVRPQCDVRGLVADEPNSEQTFEAFPFLDRGIEDADVFPDAFIHTSEHLLFTWGIMALFLVVGIILTAILLKRRDNR
jgi:ABC-type multidrug transport system ATPase subunit